MLMRLEIQNFALIRDVGLDFSPGLNILTGETGAGKSIILGAVKLLLGERAAVDNIRAGYDSSLIQGIFSPAEDSPVLEELASLGLEEGEIMISREINRQGRNLCRLNGLVIPLALLKRIGRHLMDLHGQHEHQSLLDPGEHLRFLDLMGGRPVLGLKEELEFGYRRYREVVEQIEELNLDDRKRSRKLDLLRFQLQEIQNADLEQGEEEELLRRLSILANAEKLIYIAQRAYEEIAVTGSRDPLSDRIQGIIASLEEAGRLEGGVLRFRDSLMTASEILQDTARELRVYSDDIQANPEEMAEVEKRITEIEKLKKKYGNSIEEILAYGNDIEREKEKLESAEKHLSLLTGEKEMLRGKLEGICATLSEKRKAVALNISKAMKKHLQDLALEGSVFSVSFVTRPLSSQGVDQVEFLFSANPGEPEKSLHRIVSGGELSRVMLALKNIMAEERWIPTLIFDEVDAGIGGRTVQSVGEKVSNLARNHQVICITHWPQIAAMSQRHFSISKELLEDRTITRVREVTGEERVAEIGRMLDGGEKGSLVHARTILNRAEARKKKRK